MHERDPKTKQQKTLQRPSGFDVADRHVKAMWRMAESRAGAAGWTVRGDRAGRAAVMPGTGLRGTGPGPAVINPIPGTAA
ncbi:hypothetical protein [Streptomyces collinus]|uniref:hypothetical protein n=1 Tax=Streptomyces collinus TaxID=42684 RepID=UPI003818FE9F